MFFYMVSFWQSLSHVCISGSVQKIISVWKQVPIQIMVTQALIPLAGPSLPYSDWWLKTTGRIFSNRCFCFVCLRRGNQFCMIILFLWNTKDVLQNNFLYMIKVDKVQGCQASKRTKPHHVILLVWGTDWKVVFPWKSCPPLCSKLLFHVICMNLWSVQFLLCLFLYNFNLFTQIRYLI